MAANIGAKIKSGLEGEHIMDRKAELKRLYKETKTKAGVYQIINTVNQKVFVGSTMNLKTRGYH